MTTLSDFQRGNLERLARYLWDLPQDAFDMERFSNGRGPHHCGGTVGCAVGNGPAAGIAALDGERRWGDYGNRVFAPVGSLVWWWLFDGHWAFTDNTPRGTARRILWTLRHGCPDDWRSQLWGESPLCYLDEPLDPVAPPGQPQPSGAAEPQMAEAV